MVRLQVRRGVGDQREARRVRLGKAVERERRDAAHDLVLRVARDAARGHAGAQPRLDRAACAPLERLKPIARRSSSASPPVKPATVIAMRSSCSWKSGTPSVRSQDRLERRVRIGDRLAAGAPVQIGMHHLPDDRPGPDDRDLDDEVVEASRASGAAASPSARGSRSGRRRSCRRGGSWRRSADRRAAAARGRASTPSCSRTSGIASSSAASMPRPSRSILMMPRSAQSSLSHWTTRRPGIVAGSIGTTSSRRPAAITMPPECWPRWRGRPCMRRRARASRRDARRRRVDAGRRELRVERVVLVAEARGCASSLREPVDLGSAKPSDLAHLAHARCASR